MIWKRSATLEALNAMGHDNMVGLLAITFSHIGDDSLEATMPVDSRTRQPFGLLHGGASVVLAETLGSVAGYLCTEGNNGWWGWKLTPTTCAPPGRASCAASAARCTLAVVTRCGKSIFSMNKTNSAVLPV